MSESGDDLPPLREVIAKHGLSAKKSFGQNFLLDLNLTRKIARSIPHISESFVYEVGPGPGGLTRALLMEGAKQVYATEKDPRCQPILADIQAAYGNLSYGEGDALNVDETKLISKDCAYAHIAANLPYNVGTALLTRWMTLNPWKPWFSSLTLMFQKEVAERIVARPGSKAYGRLAILCQWRAEARILFDLKPQAFTPPPKVTSSVVQIVPSTPMVEGLDVRALEKLTEMTFGKRRKMLRASMKPLGATGLEALAALEIKETARPDELSIKNFCDLAKLLQNQSLA